MSLARDGIAPDTHLPAVDCHKIDACGAGPTVPTLQLGSGRQQALLLAPAKSMHRAVAAMSAPTLDLHDDQEAPTTADEIDLRGGHPDVAPHDQVAPHEVEQRGEQLAVAPRLGGSSTQPARSARKSAGGHDTVRVA